MNKNPADEKAIFNFARRIDSPEAVSEYLNQVCGDDQQARQRIVDLLRIHEQEQSFLESPPPGINATIDAPAVSEKPGAQIGPYKLILKKQSKPRGWLACPIGRTAFSGVRKTCLSVSLIWLRV